METKTTHVLWILAAVGAAYLLLTRLSPTLAGAQSRPLIQPHRPVTGNSTAGLIAASTNAFASLFRAFTGSDTAVNGTGAQVAAAGGPPLAPGVSLATVQAQLAAQGGTPLNPNYVMPGTGQTIAELQASGYTSSDIQTLMTTPDPSSSSSPDFSSILTDYNPSTDPLLPDNSMVFTAGVSDSSFDPAAGYASPDVGYA